VITTYKILYWQEVPSQIKAEDERDEVTVLLGPRFMERIDQLAAQRGLQDADDYLSQWQWSEEQQRPGGAQDVAEAVKAELEAEADW
jgi:cvfA/B/C family virulence factor